MSFLLTGDHAQRAGETLRNWTVTLALCVALLLSACGSNESLSGSDYAIDPQAAQFVTQAQAALESGSYAAAVEFVSHAERLDGSAPVVLATKGSILYELDRLEEARYAFETLLDRYPHFAEGWLRLGNVAAKQQQFEEAVDHYRKEIALRPTPRAWHNLATAYIAIGDHDAGREAYMRSREADPSYAAAYHGLADISEREGDYETALDFTRKAHELAPHEIRTREKLGFLLLRTGENAEAERVLRAILEAEPWNYQVRYNLGQALQQQGMADEAEQELRRSEADRSGQSQLRQLQRMVTRDPANSRAYFALGTEYHKWGRLEDALRAYRVAKQLAPENPQIDLNVATIYLHRNDLDRAARELESIVQRDSTMAMAWLNLGFVRARQGDMTTARTVWDRALAKEPGFRPTVDAFLARMTAAE